MRLQKVLMTAFSCLCLISVYGSEKPTKPKLVVGLVIDQMRWDYLYKYADRYSKDGFNRLLNEGFSCENTYIPYVPTYTAIGHSTVYTGSVPAIHGISGNDFIIQESGQAMYCTQDDDVVAVGGSGKVGMQSPKNLLVSTVTDQLKLATNFRSKVIGVAIKDRGGILPAGHFGDAAYWLDGKTGHFISSSYYMESLPKWLQDFNKKNLADHYFKQGWNTLYPIESYVLSTADNTVYEDVFKSEVAPVFPRDLVKLKKENGYDLIKGIPYGNNLTLDMAKAVITNESLGNNPYNVTDFLALSLSSTDYIGHQFGINSIEIEDTYLRLDHEIAEFLKFLDSEIGTGNYTLFLTADHGAAHNPKFFKDMKGNAGYFDTQEVKARLNAKLLEKYGHDQLVKSLSNYQVHLNYQILNTIDLDQEQLKATIVKELRKENGVAFVTDMDKAGSAAIPHRIRERIINGYNYKRSGSIQIILEPQWYSGKQDTKGTTHGTWASYDSHIPAVFMGWGIKQGKSVREIHMTDIAPTISALLKIEEPNGNIGTPIYEAIELE